MNLVQRLPLANAFDQQKCEESAVGEPKPGDTGQQGSAETPQSPASDVAAFADSSRSRSQGERKRASRSVGHPELADPEQQRSAGSDAPAQTGPTTRQRAKRSMPS